MEKVIVAFADVKSEVFNPVFAEFPVAEKTVKAYYLQNDKAIVEAARIMLGLENDQRYIVGLFWNTPEYPGTPDGFFTGLRERWEKQQPKRKAHNSVLVFAMSMVTGEIFEKSAQYTIACDPSVIHAMLDEAIKQLGSEGVVARVYDLAGGHKFVNREDAWHDFAAMCASRTRSI